MLALLDLVPRLTDTSSPFGLARLALFVVLLVTALGLLQRELARRS